MDVDGKKSGGPDMMKMLHMMLPYMDPSMKRMISIMVKLRELQELMEPVEKPERQMEHRDSKEEVSPPAEPQEKEEANDNLAARLQEGLTPEQQSMITSLTGMLG